MHWIRTFILLSLIIVISSCKSTQSAYQARWQSAPIKANADVSDWLQPLWQVDNKTKLEYAVNNDRKNLYLSIRCDNQTAQMKMLSAGLEIWLDITGKKQEKVGIYYPIATPRNQQPSITPGSAPNVKELRKRFKEEQQPTATFIGFKNSERLNGTQILADDLAIKLLFDWDEQDALVYEAVVPFQTFYKETIQPSDTTLTWTIGFKLKGLERPNFSGGGMPGGGFPGSGAGLPGGGRMPDGGRMPSQQEMQQLFETQQSWLPIRLSYKN